MAPCDGCGQQQPGDTKLAPDIRHKSYPGLLLVCEQLAAEGSNMHQARRMTSTYGTAYGVSWCRSDTHVQVPCLLCVTRVCLWPRHSPRGQLAGMCSLQLCNLACQVVLRQGLPGRVTHQGAPPCLWGSTERLCPAFLLVPAPSPGAWGCHRKTAQPEEQSSTLQNTCSCHNAMEYAIHTLACVGVVLARGICGS